DVAGSPEALRPWRLSRHGRRRRLLAPLGEGGLGSPLARDLAGRGARAAPPLGGLAHLHRVGIAAALRRADVAARRRRPRATAALLLVSRAARTAEGRAGLDVPLRYRLERQERPLGRRTSAPRACARRAAPDRTRTRVRFGRGAVRRLAHTRAGVAAGRAARLRDGRRGAAARARRAAS